MQKGGVRHSEDERSTRIAEDAYLANTEAAIGLVCLGVAVFRADEVGLSDVIEEACVVIERAGTVCPIGHIARVKGNKRADGGWGHIGPDRPFTGERARRGRGPVVRDAEAVKIL